MQGIGGDPVSSEFDCRWCKRIEIKIFSPKSHFPHFRFPIRLTQKRDWDSLSEGVGIAAAAVDVVNGR